MWDATSGGNQLQNIVIDGANHIWSVNAGNSNPNYYYDPAGNLVWAEGHSDAYDAENRLVSVDGGATGQYSYDPSNQRYKKVSGGATTHYIWQGSQVIAEYDGTTGAVNSEYVYSGSRMIAKIASGVTQYFLSDRLSARLVLDTSGNVIGRQAHLPFGEDFGESGSQEKHHFTSYERDAENGTDYAVNRQYAQSVGRLNRPDPYSGSYEFGNPQSLNRYAYVSDDPINQLDPDGLGCQWVSVPIWDVEVSGIIRGYRLELVCTSGLPGPGPLKVDFPDPTKKTWHLDTKVLNKCIQQLYGVELRSFTPSSKGQNGSFAGFGPDRGNGGNNDLFTVTNDINSYSSGQITDKTNDFNARHNLPRIKRAIGFTANESGFNPYTNYTANDLTSTLQILQTQVHELGHSLALITGIEFNAGVPAEQGDVLEDCVTKNGGWKYE